MTYSQKNKSSSNCGLHMENSEKHQFGLYRTKRIVHLHLMNVKLTNGQKALIEKFGVFHEKNGMTPAQARIVALLMIVDQAELTFDEIQATLQLSKSSVSTALQSLTIMGRIEYYTKPGDRKRYFRVNPVRSDKNVDSILSRLNGVTELNREILASRSKVNPKYNSDLRHQIEFSEFLYKELSEVFKKWPKKN